jgi:hypothetical protein
VSSNPAYGEVYLIQHYVIKFVNDWRQVGGFLRVLWFPPPIKMFTLNIQKVKHTNKILLTCMFKLRNIYI